MRIHVRPHATLLALGLALGATAALADGPAAPPAPAVRPTPPDQAITAGVPDSPNDDEAAMRARMDAMRARMDAKRQAEEADQHEEAAARQKEDAMRAQMEAARRRLEVDAQRLAALS